MNFSLYLANYLFLKIYPFPHGLQFVAEKHVVNKTDIT
jgi:hypothetical protein